jgi:hypothetical protein
VPVDHAWGISRQLPDGRLFVAPECAHEVMTRRPGLFNEALAGFFRSTEAKARARAEAAAAGLHEEGTATPAAALPFEPAPAVEPAPLTVPVPPDDQTDVDWLADASS